MTMVELFAAREILLQTRDSKNPSKGDILLIT